MLIESEIAVSGVSESCSALDPIKRPRVLASAMRAHLSRSASLDRIRQFPAYLCDCGVLPQVLSYVQTSSTALQAGLTLVRGYLLCLAVYFGLVVLVVELSACCCVLLLGAKPSGLIFMLASLFAMCGMACKTIAHDPSNRTQ